MLSLTALIGMDMPFINAISKIDLLKQFGRPDMNLSFYGSISGLHLLFFGEDSNETPFQKKYGKLSRSLCEVVDKFNLVGFCIVDIHDKVSMCNIIMQIDKANGYFYDPEKTSNPKEMEIDYDSVREYYD